jgi:hypothetical protein
VNNAGEAGGAWQAPDGSHPLSVYTDAGYGVKLPSDYAGAPEAARVRASREVIQVLQTVFHGDYPLDHAYADAMAHGLATGDVHLFTVHENGVDGPISATAAIVNSQHHTTGTLRSGELGRSGKLPSMEASARPLLRSRVAWAVANLPGLDYLYSSLRSSREARLHMPSGQAIQSVWLGGDGGPLVPVQVGFDYQAAGGIEPFTRVMMPMDRPGWEQAVSETPVFVSSGDNKAMLETLVEEATQGRVTPLVVVRESTEGAEVPFYEVTPPNDKTHARYVATNNAAPGHNTATETQLEKQLPDGISHKLVIEADVSMTPDGSAIMARMQERGWTFVGWQESEQVRGALCPVLAHVNPRRIGELVMPGHGEKQFDPGTRAVFNTMYANLIQNAATHPEARIVVQ